MRTLLMKEPIFIVLLLALIPHHTCEWKLGKYISFAEVETNIEAMESFWENGTWKLSLPGYTYCGPGTPFLDYIKDWRENEPINKLDLACFYHDLVYSNAYATPELIRWADKKLIEKAKEIVKECENKATLSWKKRFRLKMEARFVIYAFKVKFLLEDRDLLTPMKHVTRNVTESWEIYDTVDSKWLPEAWHLPFYYEEPTADHLW